MSRMDGETFPVQSLFAVGDDKAKSHKKGKKGIKITKLLYFIYL